MCLRDVSLGVHCECGYEPGSFTFAVLHRSWAHHDSPGDARAWALKAFEIAA